MTEKTVSEQELSNTVFKVMAIDIIDEIYPTWTKDKLETLVTKIVVDNNIKYGLKLPYDKVDAIIAGLIELLYDTLSKETTFTPGKNYKKKMGDKIAKVAYSQGVEND